MSYEYHVLDFDYKIKELATEYHVKSIMNDLKVDWPGRVGIEHLSKPPTGLCRFFDPEEALALINNRKEIEAIHKSFEICDGSIYWNADSERTNLQLLRMVAWKTFAVFGMDEFFICKEIGHWKDGTTCFVSVVDKKAVEKPL